MHDSTDPSRVQPLTWQDIPAWSQDPTVPFLLWDEVAQGDALTRCALRDGVALVPMIPEQFLHLPANLYALHHRRAYLGAQVPARTPQWDRVKAVCDLYTMELCGLPQPDDLLTTLALPGSVPGWLAQAGPCPTGTPSPPPGPRPHVQHMDQVEGQPLEWLWWPYIPRGAITMLDGDPGIGKSLLTLYLGAIVSNGHPLPDQQGKPTLPTGPPGVVILLSAEDSVTHTIKQRLTASQANQAHIKVVTSYFDAQGEEQPLTLDAEHRPLLAQVLDTYHPALVIIDPLQAFLGKMDMHRANETRPFMRGLQELAARANTSIVCVRHPAKPGQAIGKGIHRGMGSVDFIGAARSGLFVEQHPTDKDKVLLCHIKHNLSTEGRTQVFSKEQGAFAWAGISRLSAEQIAGSGRGPHPYAFLAACFWLEEQFARTTLHAARDLEEQADARDLTWKRVKEAKAALGIVSEKLGRGAWQWTMPPLAPLPPPSPPPPTCSSYPSCATYPTCSTCPSLDKSTGYRHKGEESQKDQVSQEGQGGQVGHMTVGEADLPPPGQMRFARPAERPREGV